MRIALGLEYLGTNYHGWQMQAGLQTLQGCVENAISKVADAPVATVCAGRTDVGVHAFGQVIHFDSKAKRDLRSWVFGANNYLPPDIRVQWGQEMPSEFHARFSALSRHYRYLIYNHSLPSAVFFRRMAFYPQLLNEESMCEAARYLIGEHDFSAFRASDCRSHSSMRNVESISINRANQIISIDVIANAFLQHMVRNIVGVLLEIGSGKRSPLWAKQVLEGRDRSLGGSTASAHGLYLVAVCYANKYNLPQVANDLSRIL